MLAKPIAARGRGELLLGGDFERKLKTVVQFRLPLFYQDTGAHDETSLEFAPQKHLFDQKACGHGFTCTRVIGQEKTQRLPGEHVLVDRDHLMGQWFDTRAV